MNLAKALGLFLALFLFNTTFLTSQSVFINEFMASNDQTIADENGDFDDWVEFYNAGTTPFDLGGKYVTDDLTEPNQWQIPTTNPSLTTIPPGGYLIVWFDGDEVQGELHVSPKLGGGGEQIGLFDSDGLTPIDTLTYGEQTTDISAGRSPDGSTNFVTFPIPSPGSTNIEPLSEVVATPTVSEAGGFFNMPFLLVLSTETEGASIYFTTDGSDPDETSFLFDNAILLDASQVIRAKAFKNGATASDIVTNTYLFDVNHTFPIVSISGNPDKFFGEENGLFPNFEVDVEVPLNVEFYEPDGTQGFNQVAEVEIHGSASAILDQKSLAIKAKGSLGNSKIEYPVFPNEDIDTYRSLILRNSGQDWEYTMFRDALESTLVTDLSDLEVDIEKPNLDDQAYRPAIAYLNGEYWGIYNLRERSDKRYIKNRYGFDDNEIDLLENLDEAKEGDFLAWNSLDSLLRVKTFTDNAGLNELASLADLDNYMDYIIHNVFIDNTDWPGNNYLRWRERSSTGKWRWMTKDLDYGFGFLEVDTDNFNTGNPNINSLDRMLNPTFFFPNPDWGTILFNRLMENPVWKQDFINRMADQLNVLFSKERLLRHINEFQATYQPEINQHNQRWQNVWTWNQDVDVLRTFAEGRTEAVRRHFIESIPEVSGLSTVNLNALPAEGGQVKISTITTNQAWSGIYFNGINIPLEAIPNPGYIFAGWSANVNSTESTATINLNGDIAITAIFTPDDGTGQPLDQTINFPEIANKLTTDNPFSITATASSGLPVSFSITSGPATISNNTITLNGTVGTVVVEASQVGNAQFNAATPASRFFSVTQEDTPPSGNYCDAEGQEPWQEYIATIQFNEINNNSGKEGYGNFLNQTATVNPGEIYPITLVPGFSWAHYDENFTVWIDWNQDNDFTDTGEQVFIETLPMGINGSSANPLIGNITIPATAPSGNTRMRVSMQRDQATAPCGTHTLGEVEDYTIFVTENSGTNLQFTCPQNILVSVPIGATGAIVEWTMPIATSTCQNGLNAIVQTGGLPNSSFFPVGSSIIEYLVTDNCGNTATCDFEVRITTDDTPNNGEYCEVKGNQPWQEYIANISLNTLNNTSLKEGYADFTNLSTTLERGKEYELSLLPGFSYFQWNEVFQVWIDFNGNGSFEENGELVFTDTYIAQAGGSVPTPVVGTFAIPNSIQPINTRMRIAMKRDNAASSCETFEFGEVEDYSIEIINGNASSTRAVYLNFTAFNIGRAVETQWLTNTANTSESFILERSNNGIDFEPIKEILAPNDDQDAFFKELDTQPVIGDNFYRLKQTFKDGATTYSSVQLVNFQVNLAEITVFPNPAKDRLHLQLQEFAGQAGTIQLFDALGRLQQQQKIATLPESLIYMPIHELSNGIYFLKISIANKPIISRKVIVNRLY